MKLKSDYKFKITESKNGLSEDGLSINIKLRTWYLYYLVIKALIQLVIQKAR